MDTLMDVQDAVQSGRTNRSQHTVTKKYNRIFVSLTHIWVPKLWSFVAMNNFEGSNSHCKEADDCNRQQSYVERSMRQHRSCEGVSDLRTNISTRN